MTILSAGSIGYAIANGVALTAHYVMNTSPKFKDIETPFRLPKGWKYLSLCMLILQIAFIPCIVYWSWVLSGGFMPAIVGAIVLLAYIPVWMATQKSESVEAPASSDAE